MSKQRETNPHFFRPLQPQHQDQHSQPLGPRVPQHPQPHQDRHPQPHGSRETQPHHQGQHSQPQSPWWSRPQHQDRHPQPHQDRHSQPHGPRETQPHHQDRHSQPHGPRETQPHHQGQHSQPHGTQETQPQHHDQRRYLHGLWVPRPRTTKPLTWFAAVFCAIFWIVIILGGLIVLIVYLVFRPRSPRFDVSTATLNAAYLDMGYLLNADLTLLANFTNTNKKVSVDFGYSVIGLYYGNNLIATQYIEPFSATKTESKFANVHLVSSQVRLPIRESARLKRQIESNGIMFEVRGLFRARSNLGSFLRYSYWLYTKCTILVTSPPSGVLVASKCRTKR